ncbi:MAG TPA: phosphatase PAP2 family protein [Parvibaculum sp.]
MSGFTFLALVTEFGDQSVILPFAATVAAVLALNAARREALIWCGAIFAVLLTTLIAKFFFLPCGHLFSGLGVRSPSGHTAAAFAVYGGFAVLQAKLARARWVQAALISAAFAACFSIAVSRVLLGAHTVQEALFGGLIGVAAPAILVLVEPPASEPRMRPPLLLLIVPLVLAVLFYGETLPVEGLIDRVSTQIMGQLGVCV